MFKYLTKLEVKEDDKDDGRTKTSLIIMHFEENPYFTNSTLQIELHFDKDLPKYSKGTNIDWKEGKNLCMKTKTKKQKNKNGKERVKTIEEPQKSFFRLFQDFNQPDEMEEDLSEDFEEGTPSLYLVSDTIEVFVDIFDFSLEYYLDVAEDEEGSFGEEYDDEDEPDDGDSNDSDEDDTHHKNHKGKSSIY